MVIPVHGDEGSNDSLKSFQHPAKIEEKRKEWLTMDVVTEDSLREITQAIVDAVHPLKVILFGSYVKGHAGPDSDLDFMIIEEAPFDASRSRRREAGNIHRHLRGFRVPMDVLVYSKAEFDMWSGSRNHVVSRAAREGRVLYERT